MSFTGFPEETNPGIQVQGAVPRKVLSSGSANRRTKDRLLAAAEKKVDAVVACSADSLPEEARLSAPPPSTPVKLRISDNGRCDVLVASDTKGPFLPPRPDENTLQGTEKAINGITEEKNDDGARDDPKKTSEASTSKLEMFQEKQKFIEEQNRKRKEMLSKAILDRQKQTDQESRKLQIVQAELAKIDTLLNTDVQFLRESIEQASLEFMKAQKRYDDAEKEFIAAKLHLFGVSERKELLTDHLCSIIEQNEQRKAKRLTELMVELQLDSPNSNMASDLGEVVSLKDLRPSSDFNTLKKSESTEK